MPKSKKKLLIITGAGASLEFSMPSVKDVDISFDSWAQSEMPLSNAPNKNLYSFLRDRVNNYYSANTSDPKQTNFEEMLYLISLLYAMKNDNQYFWYAPNALMNSTILPQISRFGYLKNTEAIDLLGLHTMLVDNLLNDFRTKCVGLLTTKKPEIGLLSKFINKLKQDFEIGIVTVNYDNIFLQADNSLSTGFNASGLFEPTKLVPMNWNFYYSLHGSTHFDMKGGAASIHEIQWEANLAKAFQTNSVGRNAVKTMEGLNLITSTIIAGYDKSNQILREPFRSYFSAMPRIISEADAYLICGYGFTDFHLNHQLEAIRDRKGSSKKIVVIDWADNSKEALSQRNDDWANGLMNTLTVEGSSLGTKKYSFPPLIRDLKKDKDFEYSRNPKFPLSIWYGGFLEACKNEGLICKELS